jgi:hypothetical protein
MFLAVDRLLSRSAKGNYERLSNQAGGAGWLAASHHLQNSDWQSISTPIPNKQKSRPVAMSRHDVQREGAHALFTLIDR